MRVFSVSESISGRGKFVHPFMRPAGNPDWRRLWKFDCSPKAEQWNAEPRLADLYATRKPSGDFPYLTVGALVMSCRALEALSPIVEPCGEILPLKASDGADYAVLNITPCHDCIDEERSEGPRFADGRRFIEITRYEFKPERIPRLTLFKASIRPFQIFATEGLVPKDSEFKARIERAGLEGLTFVEVWNDEGGGRRI
jgi:hypothetical protein